MQLPATSCHNIALFWVSPVNFAAITPCIVLQLVFIVVHVKCNLLFSEGSFEVASSFASSSHKLHWKCRRWNLNLLLLSKNQSTVLSLEKSILSTLEESKASHIKHQGHIDDHLQLWEYCSSGICPSRLNYLPALLMIGLQNLWQ